MLQRGQVYEILVDTNVADGTGGFIFIPAGETLQLLTQLNNIQWEVIVYKTSQIVVIDTAILQNCILISLPHQSKSSASLLNAPSLSYNSLHAIGSATTPFWNATVKFDIDDPASTLKKCECGCASIGISNHSDYCPLYIKGE